MLVLGSATPRRVSKKGDALRTTVRKMETLLYDHSTHGTYLDTRGMERFTSPKVRVRASLKYVKVLGARRYRGPGGTPRYGTGGVLRNTGKL